MSVVPITPSMRLTPRPADSCRKGRVTTGRFLTVQSPRLIESMRDCPTLVCSPPENVLCTSPNCWRPSSFANSVSSPSSEPPVSMKGDFVPAIDAHVDDGQRASVHEFEAGLLAITVQLVRRLALEAPQLRDIQCRVLGFRLFSKTAMRDDQGK